MSTSLPEGIYPGCTAISGIAQPGAGMWVNIPGRGASVRAIVSNKIDSLTNLTLTVDRAGIARVFGVGDRVPTLERTTEFARRRPAAAPRALTGKAAIVLRIDRLIELHYFDVIGYPPVFLRLSKYWLFQSGVEPILLFQHQPFLVAEPTDRQGTGEWGFGNTATQFYLSIDAANAGTVHVDLRYKYFYEQTLFTLQQASNSVPASFKHWQVQGADIQEVEASEAWRSDFANSVGTGLNSPSNLSADLCINAYAHQPLVNLDSQYRYQVLASPVQPNAETSAIVFEHGGLAFLTLQAAIVQLQSYALSRDAACTSNSLDLNRTAYVSLDQADLDLQVRSFQTPEGLTVSSADAVTLVAAAGWVGDA